MKFVPINFEILKNPLNWLVVLLMLTIAGFALEEIFRFISPGNASDCGCKNSRSPIPQSDIA